MIAAAENCAQLPCSGHRLRKLYTRNAIVHHGRLDPDVHLLSKPFTYADLAQKVRSILDSQRVG